MKGEGTLVANARHSAILRGRQGAEYQELHEIIEYMNENQRGLLATMERKPKLMSGALGNFREKLWRTKVDGWRDTDAAEGEVTQKATSGSQSSKAEAGYSNVPEAEVSWMGPRASRPTTIWGSWSLGATMSGAIPTVS